MPEGDTIFRTAKTLETWIGGRVITAARSRTVKAPLARLIGSTVCGMEARAKHLLVRFDTGEVLHTHMRMTGAWHVYSAGERWRKPGWQAAVVLTAGDRVAVCFNAPVVELLTGERAEVEHPALAGLGPDVLRPPIDLADVRRRAARVAGVTLAVGELLLDQRIVSGIGNIYRCEALHRERVNPWTPWSEMTESAFDSLVLTTAALMQANVGTTGAGRSFAGVAVSENAAAVPVPGAGRSFAGVASRGRAGPSVYGRTGRPCPRCRTPIAATDFGTPPRRLYWCPTCQAPDATPRPV